ncbi:MAG: TIR domain-containing protein [Oscillospiraceae bacterium]|nr:TIR domain-containing protein [Oscillospiraceae bacterium]
MECGVRAYTGSKQFLFVSYSHSDAALVYPIIERLVMDGYRVWYDEGIHAGEDWTEAVADRLEASSICVAMLSENFVSSVNCRNEITYSMNVGKKVIGVKLTDFEMPKGIRLQLGNTIYLEKYRYSETEFYDRFSMSHGMAGCRAPEPRITDGQLMAWRAKWTGTAPVSPAKDEPARQEEMLPVEKPGNAGKRPSRKLLRITVLAAAVLLISGIILFSRKAEKQTVESSALASVSTPESTVSSTHTPDSAASPKDAPIETVRTQDNDARDWGALMELPGAEEIASRNQSGDGCSPFVYGSFSTGGKAYSGLSIDFKVDHLPAGTYGCVAYFDLNYPTLSQYSNVRTYTPGLTGYVGFQRLEDGTYTALMQVWDVSYTADGQEQLVRARVVQPRPEDGIIFSSGGTGVKYAQVFPWKEAHWYQVMLYCTVDQETGNTDLEFWIQDVETEQWTRLCIFDLGAPDVSFRGDLQFFLQNFYDQAAGDIRTMELRNAKILTSEWFFLSSGSLNQGSDYRGSYRFGAEGDTVYLITTGVENKAGTSQEGILFTVQPTS